MLGGGVDAATLVAALCAGPPQNRLHMNKTPCLFHRSAYSTRRIYTLPPPQVPVAGSAAAAVSSSATARVAGLARVMRPVLQLPVRRCGKASSALVGRG